MTKNCGLKRTALLTLIVFLTFSLGAVLLPGLEKVAWAKEKDKIDTLVNNKTGEVKLQTNGLEDVMKEYKALIKWVIGFCVITLVAILSLHFVKLAQSSDHPERRKSALSGIFWTLVAAAGLGSIGFVIAFATKSFSDL